MGEFFFVVKTFVITLLVVFLLQIKIGPTTIEQKSLAWMHQSSAVDALRSVAEGAVAFGSSAYDWTRKQIKRQLGSNESSKSSSVTSSGNKSSGARETEHLSKRQQAWEDDLANYEGEEAE